jgi:hypothetical protein
MGFVVSVTMDGSVADGLLLRGGCYVHRPDEGVMFQLEFAPPLERRRLPLARLDWRPPNPGHENPLFGPARHPGRFIESSHLHPLSLSEAVDAAVARLVSVRHADGISHVHLPIFYSSGAAVAVSAERVADGYLVTDEGFAFREAELVGMWIRWDSLLNREP